MAQYIDKDLLLKVIKASRNELVALMNRVPYASNYPVWSSNVDLLDEIKKAIDTLEVKEVDLEKEIEEHLKECLDVKFPTTDIELIKKDVAYTAKKFFKLGLQAQKGE